MEQTRSSYSVRSSVRPSVKRVHCDKTEEKSVQNFIPYERSFSLVSWEEWLVRATLLAESLGQFIGPRWSEIADFEPIIARSGSSVRYSEKVQLTLIGSALRPLTSLRWSSYVAPKSPKGTQKLKKAHFRPKSHFAWRKFAIKFIRVKTVDDKVVRHLLT